MKSTSHIQKIKLDLPATTRSKTIQIATEKALNNQELRALVANLSLETLSEKANVSEALMEYLLLTDKRFEQLTYHTEKDKLSIDGKPFKKTVKDIEKALFEHYKPELESLVYEVSTVPDRNVQFLVGPTNSGKTHEALSQITKLDRAVYLAPLRLLAIEVYERMNQMGIPCSLITGEERIIVEGAKMVSSTIEMLNTQQFYDIAIIDEYQLINSERGNAYTRAIINLNCEKMFLLGDEVLLKSTQHFIKTLRPDDIISVKKFTRRSKLQWSEKKVISLNEIQKGDALIVFSKANVLGYAEMLSQRGLKVSVLYGDLPVNTRRKQSENFQRGISDVVVATDVIGMGLNLPVDRIVFGAISKFDGQSVRHLTQQEMKQIAGRAGRDKLNGKVCLLDDFAHSNIAKNHAVEHLEAIFKPIKQQKQTEFPLSLNVEFLARLAEEPFGSEKSVGLNAYALYLALEQHAYNTYFKLFEKKKVDLFVDSKIVPELIPALNHCNHFSLMQKIKLCAPPINYGETTLMRYGFKRFYAFQRTIVGDYYYDMIKDNSLYYPDIRIDSLNSADYVGAIEKKFSILRWLNYELQQLDMDELNNRYTMFSAKVQKLLTEKFLIKQFRQKISQQKGNIKESQKRFNEIVQRLDNLKATANDKASLETIKGYMFDPLVEALSNNPNITKNMLNSLLNLEDKRAKLLFNKNKEFMENWAQQKNASGRAKLEMYKWLEQSKINGHSLNKPLFNVVLERAFLDKKGFNHFFGSTSKNYNQTFIQVFDLLLLGKNEEALNLIQQGKDKEQETLKRKLTEYNTLIQKITQEESELLSKL